MGKERKSPTARECDGGRRAGCETVGADGIGARGWIAGHGCGSWGGRWVGKKTGLSVL